MASFSSAAFLVSSLIQGSVWISSPSDFFESGDQLVHAFLGGGREVLLDPVLADGFAERASVREEHCFQRAWGCSWPASVFAKKAKFSSKKALGTRAPGRAAHASADSFSRNQEVRLDQAVQRFEEIGRGHIERVEMADADAVKVGAPVKVGSELVEVGTV